MSKSKRSRQPQQFGTFSFGNQQGRQRNMLNQLDPQTLTDLYMKSVNSNPNLHPGVTQGNVDDITYDFISWCAGVNIGVQQAQQLTSSQGRNQTLQFPQQGQRGQRPQVNVNSLPSTIRTALQSIVSQYGSGVGQQRRTA